MKTEFAKEIVFSLMFTIKCTCLIVLLSITFEDYKSVSSAGNKCSWGEKLELLDTDGSAGNNKAKRQGVAHMSSSLSSSPQTFN